MVRHPHLEALNRFRVGDCTALGQEPTGVEVRRMTKEDYLDWLQLAQQTAWLEYTKINPRSQELLMTLVRTFLDSMGDVK
jgi:hypothetical protein